MIPVKRVRTPIKGLHGINSMMGSRRELGQEVMDEERIMTLNSPYTGNFPFMEVNNKENFLAKENIHEEYVGSRILNNGSYYEKPIEKIIKTVERKASLQIPKLQSLKRGMKEPLETEIEDSLGMVLSKQATERRETEDDTELHNNLYMMLSERQKKKGRGSASPQQMNEMILATGGGRQDSERSPGAKRDLEKGEDLIDDLVVDLKRDALYVYEHK